jgi:hypothetical protein
MTTNTSRLRQVMDWRAAFLAGVAAGLLFLVVLLIAATVATGDSLGEVLRYPAAALLGEDVFLEPGPAGLDVILVGLLGHMIASVLVAMLIALILHRWGLLVGVVGGAIIGAATYVIAVYGLPAVFEWLAAVRSWPLFAGFVLFGAVAGGLYEAMERDRFVAVTEV